MKKTFLITALTFLLYASAIAQADTISAAAAEKYIGKEVVLRGKLVSTKVHQDRNGKDILFIDIDERYPNSKISVTVFNEALAGLTLGGADIGKTILIHGIIKTYRDRPSIGINDAEDVVLEE